MTWRADQTRVPRFALPPLLHGDDRFVDRFARAAVESGAARHDQVEAHHAHLSETERNHERQG